MKKESPDVSGEFLENVLKLHEFTGSAAIKHLLVDANTGPNMERIVSEIAKLSSEVEKVKRAMPDQEKLATILGDARESSAGPVIVGLRRKYFETLRAVHHYPALMELARKMCDLHLEIRKILGTLIDGETMDAMDELLGDIPPPPETIAMPEPKRKPGSGFNGYWRAA